ncbi:hypothetical protein Plhal304r1_c042g0120621 [Plasmopara halstedii]
MMKLFNLRRDRAQPISMSSSAVVAESHIKHLQAICAQISYMSISITLKDVLAPMGSSVWNASFGARTCEQISQ